LKLEFKSRRVRGKLCLIIQVTAFEPLKIHVFGHSFGRRLPDDLKVPFDDRACRDFHLQGTAKVRLYGVGGLTVSKLRQRDLSVVSSFAPDIVILEIGTNDLTVDQPEVVGSAIEELVHFLKEVLSIRERRFLTNLSLCLTSIFEWYYPLFRTFFAGNIEVFTALLDLLTNLMGFMSIPLVSVSYIGVIGAPC